MPYEGGIRTDKKQLKPIIGTEAVLEHIRVGILQEKLEEFENYEE
jgi:hypothetical protein